MRFLLTHVTLLLATALANVPASFAVEAIEKSSDPPVGLSPAERGYWFLTQKSYLPPDFHASDLAATWKNWPAAAAKPMEQATDEKRREILWDRYGIDGRLEDPSQPLQYVVEPDGDWTMNCFACHGGSVEGKTWPGAPNRDYALQTLTEEIRMAKLVRQRPLSRMDTASVAFPLGANVGTTNAVMFGVALAHFRDERLNVHKDRGIPDFVHHDLDAPPWWHFKKKTRLYADGFAQKSSRALMQFMMVPQNGPDRFAEWEADYRDVYAYLESIEPPKWPHAVDRSLAEKGKTLFTQNCAECHGTYDDVPAKETYPERIVPWDDIGTDRVRLDALTKEGRAFYARSWFSHFGRGEKTILEPGGYVAPPLDGIWASAPYFHNGSVPTLAHVLDPASRPVIWTRTSDATDQSNVGLTVETFERMPSAGYDRVARRSYFDTRKFGKSAAGHDFGEVLSADERRAVIEYLKTL
jgi:mono/diheme cytochrome c family protein